MTSFRFQHIQGTFLNRGFAYNCILKQVIVIKNIKTQKNLDKSSFWLDTVLSFFVNWGGGRGNTFFFCQIRTKISIYM